MMRCCRSLGRPIQNPFADMIGHRFSTYLACMRELQIPDWTALPWKAEFPADGAARLLRVEKRKAMIRHAGRAGWGLHNASNLVLASVAPLHPRGYRRGRACPDQAEAMHPGRGGLWPICNGRSFAGRPEQRAGGHASPRQDAAAI